MYERILSNLNRHVQLNDEEKELFTSCIKVRKLRKRQYFLQPGDIMRFECFVTEGCLRQYYVDEKGQEHSMMFAFEDWWTGDMYSFLSGQPSKYHLEAIEDTTLLLIERSQLEQLYDQIPQLNRFYRILLQNAYIVMSERINQSLSMAAEERYQAFQQRYPHFEQRLSLKHIASYLGITPESLSRIRAQRKNT
ncbi:MAG: Crp/Fnr family transcriptional regulator [Pseudobacter sp.]|uniref:Crp/Fnr family transcriptional regulator n=1 Tax=Pseudobacter sp. TaxID=2045420 RepID=UPI003F7F27B7